MKSNILKTGIYSIAIAALLAGCKGSSNGSFQTDETTGVQYRLITHDDKGAKPVTGDFVNVQMIGKTEKDSVLFNSIKQGGDSLGTFKIPITNAFKGCLEQGFTLMAKGDSAEFKVSADSLYLKSFHAPKLPAFIRPGSFITFNIKLVKFETAAQVKEERTQMMQKRMAEMQARKAAEPGMIAKYIADNKVTAKPSPDSLFFVMREGKNGKAIKDGDSVYVKYTGMLLDNTVFETSDHGPGHNSIAVVYSKDMHLIRGWVEALGTMHEGEKVRILLPSAIAYGPQGAPHSQMILPYTPLVFDLEILKVVSPKK
jgi:FKBP-type peptidyl-prolyl cis-trans isomerase FkpA